jgi:hypothetical protein
MIKTLSTPLKCFALLFCFVISSASATGPYKPPLTFPQSPTGRSINAGESVEIISKYTLHSNVTKRSLPFTIEADPAYAISHHGFSCGAITAPSITAGGTCNFQLIMHEVPKTAQVFVPKVTIRLPGQTRGGGSAALSHSITINIAKPSDLFFVSKAPTHTETQAGSSIDLDYTIQNATTGTDAQTMTLTLVPTNDIGTFVRQTVSNNCGATLAAGASCNIRYRYTDGTAGTANVSLTVTANANAFTTVLAPTQILIEARPMTWLSANFSNSKFGGRAHNVYSPSPLIVYAANKSQVRESTNGGLTEQGWQAYVQFDGAGAGQVTSSGENTTVFSSGNSIGNNGPRGDIQIGIGESLGLTTNNIMLSTAASPSATLVFSGSQDLGVDAIGEIVSGNTDTNLITRLPIQMNVQALSITPGTGTLFAASIAGTFDGTPADFDASEVGVYKGINNGTATTDWSNTGLDVSTATITSLFAMSADIIYVGTSAGVYRTVNGGDNWTGPLTTGLPSPANIKAIFAIPNNPNDPGVNDVVYVGTCDGVYRSQNAGTVWVASNIGLKNICITSLSGSGTFPDETLYASVYTASEETGYSVWRGLNLD